MPRKLLALLTYALDILAHNMNNLAYNFTASFLASWKQENKTKCWLKKRNIRGTDDAMFISPKGKNWVVEAVVMIYSFPPSFNKIPCSFLFLVLNSLYQICDILAFPRMLDFGFFYHLRQNFLFCLFSHLGFREVQLC